jgi:hypothetical protein
MDNISIAKPTVDNTVVESIQNVSVHDAEIPVQLEVEWTDEAGNVAVQTHAIPASQLAQAQRIIAGAKEVEKCKGGTWP